MHWISFRIHILIVWVYIFYKYVIGNPWKYIGGIALPLHRKIGFNTLRWIINGRYEEAEFSVVSKHIDDKDIVLEIGTGMGFLSAYCAKIIGSDKVFTFEANPENILVAKKVFKKNQVNPFLENAILGSTQGTQKFPVNNKSRLASTLLKQSNSYADIPVLNLNELISKIKPTFLLMDIEGAEYDIINIINFQSIRKIQVELHPELLGKHKTDDIFLRLKEQNFIIAYEHTDKRNCYFTRK